MKRINFSPLLIVFFCALFPIKSFANTGETYGFGAKASGLGNTMLGSFHEAFSTYYNPALNSAKSGFQFSYGLSYANYDFKGISGVTVSNNAITSDPGDVVGTVDTNSYLAHFAHGVGATFNFGEDFFIRNLALGFMAFLPVERIAYLDSGEPFKPEYFGYRSQTQRPELYTALSVNPFSKFYFGGGLAFGTNLSGSVQVTATGSANSVSSQRFASTIKPTIAPYFGVFADFDSFNTGLTVRLKNEAKVDLDTSARARLLGPTNDLPLYLNSVSTVYYDPLQISLGFASPFFKKLWATAEISWYEFGAFEPATMKINDAGSAFKIKDSLVTAPEMRSILVPKVGAEYNFAFSTVRAGYLYRPTPVRSNTGPGNLIDPSKHVFSLGGGLDFEKAKWTTKKIQLDLYLQYHLLVGETVTKTAGNELGTSGQTKVGAPSYETGGSIYGGGLSLTMAF